MFIFMPDYSFNLLEFNSNSLSSDIYSFDNLSFDDYKDFISAEILAFSDFKTP